LPDFNDFHPSQLQKNIVEAFGNVKIQVMHPVQRRQAFSGLDVGIILAHALIFVLIASVTPVCAQTRDTITNIAQLTQTLDRGKQLVANLELDATVFACDTNTGALILQDSTGAELLEMDDLQDNLQPGDVIHIDAKPGLLSVGQYGISVMAYPLLDDDGIHGPHTVSGTRYFEAGRHPLQLDWFNQRLGSDLQVSCTPSESKSSTVTNLQTNLLHAVRAECFQGSWSKLPNFRMLRPVRAGSVTNFGLEFRTRDEMIGIRFEGYFDAPESGNYAFSLSSDDGSRLWIDPISVPVKKISTAAAPAPKRVSIAEPMKALGEHRLVTIEGRPSFISRFGKGLTLELRSGQNSVSVLVPNAENLENSDLLNAYVRVSGIATSVLTDDQTIRIGTVTAPNAKELTILDRSFARGKQPSTLTTIMQVHSLTRDEATLKVPVRIRGTVTALAPVVDRWMVMQDDTRGVFVDLSGVPNCHPNIGEYWTISGHTQPGDFSPMIVAEEATLQGKSRMPEPARPTWGQLANGSMDVQWVELQGLVTGIHSNNLSLVTADGHLEVGMANWGESELKSFDHAIVSIRGALFAVWNAETHEVRVANITIFNGSVMVDTPAPSDPFDTPEKTVRNLLRFDPQATPFQRVKIRGLVTYADPKRIFIERGAGIEVLPSTNVNFKVGDAVEAVGYPEIHGKATRLREAFLRKTGGGVLPTAPRVPDSELATDRFAAVRICVEGKLVGFHAEEDALVLQVQTPTYLILARVPGGTSLRSLRPGSKLALTGVYVPNADLQNPKKGSHFELLLSGPNDVAVLSKPSWWTLQRSLTAVGLLLVTLALAGVWIAMLRRKVAQRTLLLKHEIRERERVEREHALEAERSRIARDLHDDLGSRLTEINFLANTSQLPGTISETHTIFEAISERARALVTALDVIVWAVNPGDNSLQSLADYLCSYTREYLTNSSILCRFKVPIACPDMTIDGKVRHEVFMVVKETLNNIVRHAEATEVKFQMAIDEDALKIAVIDNGKGFDPAVCSTGHGLKNCSTRLAKLGGTCDIESLVGIGTTVRIEIPLQFLTVFHTEEQKSLAG
jgi:signal transduction histidine kinase